MAVKEHIVNNANKSNENNPKEKLKINQKLGELRLKKARDIIKSMN